MDVQSFDNVWDALTDTPAEAANMTARSDLLLALQRTIGSWGVTHEAAARRLGITRPRISDLLAGKIGKFSLDALVNLAAQAGLGVELRIRLEDQHGSLATDGAEESLAMSKLVA